MSKAMNVNLTEMHEAREARAIHQRKLLSEYGRSLLCFTMNIAGPVKNSALIQRGFRTGLNDLMLQLQRASAPVLYKEVWNKNTGNEAFVVADLDRDALKELACQLEDADDLERLYDMDVLIPFRVRKELVI